MGGVLQQVEHVAASASAGEQLIAASVEVPLDDAGAPARTVKLIPIGTFTLRDGRGPYRIRDRAHAEQVVAATRAWLGSSDFSWDYNHQVLATGAQGGSAEAIAAGWTKPATLSVRDDGIYADVEWTPRADERLRAREFRYLSPLFTALKPEKGGDVLRLTNAALTNVGAIDLPAIAAGISGEEDTMDLAAFLALLGLPADATQEAVAAAIANLKKPATADTSAIAVAVGLAADASVEQIAAGVTALKVKNAPDLSGYVPASVAEGMKAQLAQLTEDRLGKKVDDLVAAGIVIPAKRDATLAWFKADEVAASAFFKDMPPVVEPGEAMGSRKPGEKVTSLSADEQVAASVSGLSPTEYLEMVNGEAK
jgi:phage I-like protein